MSLAAQQSLESHYVMHTFGRSPVEFVEGHGMKLTGDDGREYLDFLAGIGVCSLGHGNLAVLSALEAQTKKLMHVSNYFYIEQRGQVAALLSKLANDDVDGARVLADAIAAGDETTAAALGAPAADEQVWETFFANSGAEANECAVKIARKYGEKRGAYRIVTLENSFHGRTLTTLAATGQEGFHREFLPLTEGFLYAQAGDLEGIQALLDGSVCAVMLEMVQGEGGVIPMDEGFVKGLAQLCREKDVLLLIDEVQTGIGRTGRFFAYQGYGVQPDVVTCAKGIAGGLPMGACLVSERLGDILQPGQNGSTFGGNPIASAAARVVVRRVSEPAFLQSVAEKGAYFREKLEAMPQVEYVRGRGLMLGVKLKEKDAHDVLVQCAKAGLLILTAKELVRFLPPLTITQEDIDQGLAIFQQVLAQ